MGSVEVWNLYSGEMAVPLRTDQDGVTFDYELPPCGSLLLFLDADDGRPVRRSPLTTTEVAGTEPVISRLSPNVLTLDYLDVTAGGETKTNVQSMKPTVSCGKSMDLTKTLGTAPSNTGRDHLKDFASERRLRSYLSIPFNGKRAGRPGRCC
jgi:hypothetical protein